MARTTTRWWQRQKARERLTDLYTPTAVQVWLRCDGDDFETAANSDHGEPPEWFHRDILETGWRYVLDVGTAVGGWPAELQWLLEYGLLPGQPFLVQVDEPRWYKTGEYGSEWDCEFDWHFIRAVPRTEAQIARGWDAVLHAEEVARTFKTLQRERHVFLARSVRTAMYLSLETYFGSQQSWWDDMTFPCGIRYSLCSDVPLDGRLKSRNSHYRRVQTAILARGEDDAGSHELALRRLVAAAQAELPGLDEAFIRALPQQSQGW